MSADAKPERLTVDQIQTKLDTSPFIAFCGLKVVSVDHIAQELKVDAPMRPEFERGASSGQWHGGPIASIIDTVGDYALAMMLGRALPTVNFRVDYLKPAVATSLTVVAKVRRLGRSVGVADVDVYDNNNSLVAIGRATYSTQ